MPATCVAPPFILPLPLASHYAQPLVHAGQGACTLASASPTRGPQIYTNPSIFACLESQYSTAAIATIMNLRPSALPPYSAIPQAQFGANFFALANRTDINLIADVAGKRLEGADLTGLGAGQAQWRHMFEHNLSFWNLPLEVIFSHNQNGVAGDVAAGRADVGMVRTDLLEGLQNPTCKPTAAAPCFPPGTFKILEPQTFPGFPFKSSTQARSPSGPTCCSARQGCWAPAAG